MSNYIIAICRQCGDSGYTIDEFTSPYTGLCAKCSNPQQEELARRNIIRMFENATREGAD